MNPKAVLGVFIFLFPIISSFILTNHAHSNNFHSRTNLVERLLSQVDSSSLSTVEVVANALLLWVRVKVEGFDSWLLGDAIGEDDEEEALAAATRMDKQIAVSVLLFIGNGGGE